MGNLAKLKGCHSLNVSQMSHAVTSLDTWCLAGKKAGKQSTLSSFLVQPASKGKAGSSQPLKGKAASGKTFLDEHKLRK